MQDNLKPDSNHVQTLINNHYKMMSGFQDVTKEVYSAYAKLYLEHPDFILYFQNFDKNLSQFMSEAMLHYIDRNL